MRRSGRRSRAHRAWRLPCGARRIPARRACDRATERWRYNEEVKTYNAAIKQIATVVFAGCMGFKPAEYLDVPESAQAVPRVQF